MSRGPQTAVLTTYLLPQLYNYLEKTHVHHKGCLLSAKSTAAYILSKEFGIRDNILHRGPKICLSDVPIPSISELYILSISKQTSINHCCKLNGGELSGNYHLTILTKLLYKTK